MLEVRNLSVSYGQHRALDSATVTVRPREIVVILGANGAGKSTLLKAISGVCEGRVTGEVLMDGTNIVGWPANRIVEQGIALVPEGRGIFGDLTVQENLALGAYSTRARDDEAGNLAKVYDLFPKLGERRRQTVRTMSGGEQQMVALGRAMMSNPQILALDEPSLGLSPLLCRDLFDSLKRVREAGIGILLVEQNAKQSLRIADRGYLLENAMIIREDAAETLINDPAVQQAYLGAAAGSAPGRKVGAPADRTRQKAASPSEIAADAMKSVQRVPAGASAATGAAGMSSKNAGSSSMAMQNPTGQRNVTRTAHGIDIESLVSRARTKSAQAVSHRPNGGQAGKPRDMEPAMPKRPVPPMPQPGDSSDRLRTMLREIEDAAEKARNYRQTGR